MSEGGDDRDRERCAEELLEGCLDRLNAGETVDRAMLLREHPDVGPEVLRQLDAYEAMLGSSLSPSGAVPAADEGPLGVIGDYRLLRRVGRGGMGVVYEAWQGSLERRVALKVLPAGLAADPKAVSRFAREARLAAKLHHPNIVGVFGMGIEAETPYFAMELVEGETLAAEIARRSSEGREPDSAVCRAVAGAFAGTAEGLHAAHRGGVVHRDLKPSNLIRDPDGRLRILDFGLARLEGDESLTLSGDVLGTPQYMSPEQARRRKIPIDHRTDIYSLGASLYEALTLEPPFRGKDHADTLTQIIERDPAPPRALNAAVPPELETIVLKCLRKEPGDRYATAEALAQDLGRFLRGDPVEARSPSAWDRLRRRLWRRRRAIAGAALTILILAGFLWSASAARRAQRQEAQARYPVLVRDAAARLAVARARLGQGFEAWGHPVPGVILTLGRAAGEVAGSNATAHELVGIIESLCQVTAFLPDGRDAHYHLAAAHLLAGDDARARLAAQQALAIDPGFVPAQYVFARLEKRPLSTMSFPAGVGSVTSWGPAWLMTRLPETDGVNFTDWPSLRQAYDQLVDEPDEPYLGFDVEAYLGRGAACLAVRDLAGAERDFAVASHLIPDSLEPDLLLARTYALGSRHAEASKVLAAAQARWQKKSGAGAGGAVRKAIEVQAWLGNHEGALEWTALLGDSLERGRWRTILLGLLGRHDEAEEAARGAVRSFPGSSLSHEILATALVKRLDAESVAGIDQIQQALEACDHGLEVDAGSTRLALLRKRAEAWQRKVSQGGGATEAQLDDFSADPDPFSASPGAWEMRRGSREAVSRAPEGGILLEHGTSDPNTVVCLQADRCWAGDLTLRAQFSYRGRQGGPWLFFHHTGEAYYTTGIQRWVSGSRGLFVERLEAGATARQEIVPLDFDPVDGQEYFIEVSVNGRLIEARAWAAVGNRPAAPQLTLEDRLYRSGLLGFGYDGDGAARVVRIEIEGVASAAEGVLNR